MALCREMTAPHATVEARKLLKGTVIRFVQDTLVHQYDGAPELESTVYVGRVGENVTDGLGTAVDVVIDNAGRFIFNPRTLVEVITDPWGMTLPYTEEMTIEQTATRASRAIPDEEYLND